MKMRLRLWGGNSDNGLMGRRGVWIRWEGDTRLSVRDYKVYETTGKDGEATVFEKGMSPTNQYCSKVSIWAFSRYLF